MIELVTYNRENYIILTDIFVSVEDTHNNPYNTIFKIIVKSGSYSGVGNIETDFNELIKFSNSLKSLYKSLQGRSLIKDLLHEPYLLFEGDNKGHINISGYISEYEARQSLNFSFEIDQTTLKSFAEQLENFISNAV